MLQKVYFEVVCWWKVIVNRKWCTFYLVKMSFELDWFKFHHRFSACEIKEMVCFFIMLEDCRICLGVKFAQRYNIVETPSMCEENRCTLGWKRERRYIFVLIYFTILLFFLLYYSTIHYNFLENKAPKHL